MVSIASASSVHIKYPVKIDSSTVSSVLLFTSFRTTPLGLLSALGGGVYSSQTFPVVTGHQRSHFKNKISNGLMRPHHPSITPSPAGSLIPLYRRPHHKSATADKVQMRQPHWATLFAILSRVAASRVREGEKKKENSQITAQTAGADFITFNLC